MKIKKTAMSLTEILVSLAIIGTITALTMPALLTSVQDNKSRVAWKSTYGTIAQAIEMMMMDNHGHMEKYVDAAGTPQGKTALYPDITRYLKVTDHAAGNGIRAARGGTYKDLAGNTVNGQYLDDGQLILANGAFLMIEDDTNNAGTLSIWVDVNGINRGPNVLGRDLFGLSVLRRGTAPFGSVESRTGVRACDSATFAQPPFDSTTRGIGCSATFLAE